jgi:hypothetical protein
LPCQGFFSLPLRPGVAELDAGHRAHVLDDRRHAGQAFDLRVVVDPAQPVPVRPSGVIAICSGNTKPNPPAARDPISMTWKSPMRP